MKKVNYGRSVRNVVNVFGITTTIPRRLHKGPAPKRYPEVCHGEANLQCIKCYRWPVRANDFFKFWTAKSAAGKRT